MTYVPHPWDKYGGPGARKSRRAQLWTLTKMLVLAGGILLGLIFLTAMWGTGGLVAGIVGLVLYTGIQAQSLPPIPRNTRTGQPDRWY